MKQLQVLTALALFAAFAGVSRADTTIGTEDHNNGFVGNVGNTAVKVGSDGEQVFDPFTTGVDNTDAIDFTAQNPQAGGNDWFQAGDSAWLLKAGTTSVWYLPAMGENGNTDPEPVGHWISASPWIDSVLGTYLINEDQLDGGGVSDVITLFNDANGANLTFASDPFTANAAPTPSTALSGLALLGVVGGGSLLRRRAKVAA
jgi:hypothetical protein